MTDPRMRTRSTVSSDGTPIAYHSLGSGPGLVVVGGVLSNGTDYLPLARALAGTFEVHLMERRGRPGSGPQRQDHGIDDECSDLTAMVTATGSKAAFGHSFGALVVLETARRTPTFDEIVLYDPGMPLAGGLHPAWVDEYQRRLDRGDRRGAFAWMVKTAGFAPQPVRVMPLWYVKLILRIVLRGEQWTTKDRLLEANLAEHRIQDALDAPDASRFSAISTPTLLLAGAKGPDLFTRDILGSLDHALPNSTSAVLPRLGHLAPENHPGPIAEAILDHHNHVRAANAPGAPAPSAAPRHGTGPARTATDHSR